MDARLELNWGGITNYRMAGNGANVAGRSRYVTEGTGLAQARGGNIVEIRAGDVIHTPRDEWHWHGAAPGHFMTHLSITEAVPGDERPEADWGDHVTDEEYDRR